MYALEVSFLVTPEGSSVLYTPILRLAIAGAVRESPERYGDAEVTRDEGWIRISGVLITADELIDTIKAFFAGEVDSILKSN